MDRKVPHVRLSGKFNNRRMTVTCDRATSDGFKAFCTIVSIIFGSEPLSALSTFRLLPNKASYKDRFRRSS